MSITPRPAADRRGSVVVFAAITFLSAFLLFALQPLLGKAILPWYGGCPAVWTTCMLFFQMLLLGGYLYAHFLQRWLTTRRQVMVHLAVVVAAIALLPIIPAAHWKPLDGANPTWRILLLLAATAGLPYFALSATSPLVQAWFGESRPGQSPYRLYALSNLGSLGALLCYPFFFEWAFDLPKQSMIWSAGFMIYGGLCAACVAMLWRFSVQTSVAVSCGDCCSAETTSPTWFRRLCWLALPACASLMLLAATNHVCQNVATVPLLWIVPLVLYLLSFIICFDHARWYVRPLWAALALVSLCGVVVNDFFREINANSRLSPMDELALYLGALFFACMVCHGELVRLKPSPRHLTEFYLWVAAGGALGGTLVCLVAPFLFATYLEWQIGVAVSVVLCVGLLTLPGIGRRGAISRDLRYIGFGCSVAVGVAFIALWYHGTKGWQGYSDTLDRARNFFGAVSVMEYHGIGAPTDNSRSLKNGRITHGRQFLDPAKRRWPTAYYGEESGVGRAIHYLQKAGPIRVGAIGLGVGTLAVYAAPGDEIRFYEINPEVERMARQHFTFLADCRGRSNVVLGDARLSLEAEPPQKFNLLVLDAFSGDAIPTHLLTREAFDVYLRHLLPDGVIAIHISNNYLRLAPVVRRLAEHCGMKTARVWANEDNSRLQSANEWMLLSRNNAFLESLPPPPLHPADDAWQVPLWTDRYSNLFQILGSPQ